MAKFKSCNKHPTTKLNDLYRNIIQGMSIFSSMPIESMTKMLYQGQNLPVISNTTTKFPDKILLKHHIPTVKPYKDYMNLKKCSTNNSIHSNFSTSA